MKIRVTNKAVKGAFKNIIVVPNCALRALDYLEANYYSCGSYGWNYDAYIVSQDTIIVAGYRPVGNVKPTAVQIDNCNKQCMEVKQAYNKHLDWQRFESDLKQILTVFAADAVETVCPF